MPALEKVLRLGIEKDPASMYFVRGDKVMKMGPGSPRPAPVELATFQPERGYVYVLDGDGDLARKRSVEPVAAPAGEEMRPAPGRRSALKPHKGFARLAKFVALSIDEAVERYRLDALNPDWTLASLFGGTPDVAFVHRGSPSARAVRIGSSGDRPGVYIIDGDLAVDGLLEYFQTDGASLVHVTGSVRAGDLALEDGAQLWIGKSLVVGGIIVDGMSDAGTLWVGGSTSAKAIIGAGRSSSLSFAKKPRARIIESRAGLLEQFPKRELASKALARPFNGQRPVDYSALVQALKKGRSVLR